MPLASNPAGHVLAGTRGLLREDPRNIPAWKDTATHHFGRDEGQRFVQGAA